LDLSPLFISATLKLRLMPAPIQPEDLKWLACPVCRGALVLDAEAVRCTGCARRYPVVDGIPVLLANRAS
jgi:hypothetical protein